MNKREARIRWMHNRTLAGNYPNENRIAEKFGVTRRTAERDIYYMKNTLGAPLLYDPAHMGFYYTKEYTLPLFLTDGNDEEYAGIKAKLTNSAGNDTNVQLQIPYVAELMIPDKLTAMELKSFIVSGKRRKGLYVCEFHSIELFLGMIMTLDSDITILSPEWLREKAVSASQKILRNNG